MPPLLGEQTCSINVHAGVEPALEAHCQRHRPIALQAAAFAERRARFAMTVELEKHDGAALMYVSEIANGHDVLWRLLAVVLQRSVAVRKHFGERTHQLQRLQRALQVVTEEHLRLTD